MVCHCMAETHRRIDTVHTEMTPAEEEKQRGDESVVEGVTAPQRRGLHSLDPGSLAAGVKGSNLYSNLNLQLGLPPIRGAGANANAAQGTPIPPPESD